MPANRTKLIVSLFLGILLCTFGCIGFAEIAKKGSEGQAPIRRLRIIIDVNRREELFAQLREYADKHNFDFYLTFYDRDKQIFLVEMVREDLEIQAVDATDAPTMIKLDFYDKNSMHPTPKETVDELISDLKSFISNIPNVTLTEQ